MIKITFDEERFRSVAADGEKLIGECDCRVDGLVWTAYHTEVDPAYGGQGIAARLVTCAAQAARERGAKIMPTCSYVVRLFDTKAEYADVDARR